MKKIFLGVVIPLVIFSVALVYGDPNQQDFQVAQKEMEEAITRIERLSGNPSKLNMELGTLNYTAQKHWGEYLYKSPEVTRGIAIRLLKIFNQINDIQTNGANKLRIIEWIGRYDNSPEAHTFFLQLINSNNPKYREMALWSMGRNGLHGDDIYDAVKKLLDAGVLKREEYLYALKSANPNRALKEIQSFLAKTTNVNAFTSYGLLLCDYRNPELLDILIDRYDEFKNKVPESPEERAVFAPARAAFHPGILKQYLEIREGARFAKALEVLGAKGISGEADLPLLAKKLKNSRNTDTKRAILNFLDYQVTDLNVSHDQVKKILLETTKTESNPELQLKTNQILKKVAANGY